MCPPASSGKAAAAAAQGSDIWTPLNYNRNDGTRPWFALCDLPGKARSGGEGARVECLVRDGRGAGLSLDANAFELVEAPTVLQTEEFYGSQDKVRSVYYGEVVEAIKKATGAAHVEIVSHQVRNRERTSGDGSVQSYAPSVHTDADQHGADKIFRGLASKACSRGRYMYINAWRNIADTPIGDDHLAVMDATSLVLPDDAISSDLYLTPGQNITQFRLSDRNAARHRWFYFPAMAKDEVLLFKQFDSDPTITGRICFHTSCTDPGARPSTPPRQSIEVRALAFFPDHEPNTCPEPETQGASSGDPEVDAALQRLTTAVAYLDMWPSWLRVAVRAQLAARGRKGMEWLARLLVQDAGNHTGLKDASQEVKEKVLAVMLTEGSAWEVGLRTAVDKIVMRDGSLLSALVAKPLYAAAPYAATLALGYGLCYVLQARRR